MVLRAYGTRENRHSNFQDILIFLIVPGSCALFYFIFLSHVHDFCFCLMTLLASVAAPRLFLMDDFFETQTL